MAFISICRKHSIHIQYNILCRTCSKQPPKTCRSSIQTREFGIILPSVQLYIYTYILYTSNNNNNELSIYMKSIERSQLNF